MDSNVLFVTLYSIELLHCAKSRRIYEDQKITKQNEAKKERDKAS